MEIVEILEARLANRPLAWEERFADELRAVVRVASEWPEFELVSFCALPVWRMRREEPGAEREGDGWVELG